MAAFSPDQHRRRMRMPTNRAGITDASATRSPVDTADPRLQIPPRLASSRCPRGQVPIGWYRVCEQVAAQLEGVASSSSVLLRDRAMDPNTSGRACAIHAHILSPPSWRPGLPRSDR